MKDLDAETKLKLTGYGMRSGYRFDQMYNRCDVPTVTPKWRALLIYEERRKVKLKAARVAKRAQKK